MDLQVDKTKLTIILQSSWNWIVKVASIASVQVIACALAAAFTSTFAVVMGWDLIKQFLTLDDALINHIDDLALMTAISISQLMIEITFMADCVIGGIAVILWGKMWGRMKYWRFLRKGGVGEYYHLYTNEQMPLYEYFAEKHRKTMSQQNP